MSVVQIEKGIPITPKCSGKPGQYSYPFGDMQIGDSFAVPLGTESGRIQNKVSSAISMWRKRTGTAAKFATRVNREEGVIRCWRVA